MKRIDKIDTLLKKIDALATEIADLSLRAQAIMRHVAEARKLVARIKNQATAHRSAVSGHYIKPAAAKANPRETSREGGAKSTPRDLKAAT